MNHTAASTDASTTLEIAGISGPALVVALIVVVLAALLLVNKLPRR